MIATLRHVILALSTFLLWTHHAFCEEVDTGAILVRVVDADDKPVAISRVQLWSMTPTGGRGYTFATKEHERAGTYRVDGVPVGRYQGLKIHEQGFAEYWVPDIVVESKSQEPLICRLSKGGRIAGLVTATSGEPLRDIPVVVNSPRCRRDVTTNEDGVFVAAHLPDVSFSVSAEPGADSPYTPTARSGIAVGTMELHLILEPSGSGRKREVAASRPGAGAPGLQVEQLVRASLRSRERLTERLVGQPAPAPLIEKWIGTTFWELDLKNRVVVLEFWGMWCGPCKRQIPMLRQLHKDYHARGLRIIGIHTQYQKERLSAFLATEPIPYPVGVDFEDRTSKMYNVVGYPTTVVIDREGEIRAVSPERLEEIVQTLLNEGRPDRSRTGNQPPISEAMKSSVPVNDAD